MRVVNTGTPGFIDSDLVRCLHASGIDGVAAVDNVTDNPTCSKLLGAKLHDYFDEYVFCRCFACGAFGRVGFSVLSR